VSMLNTPRGLALDSTSVYWSVTGDSTDGAIERLTPK
jgi:hypothetical protein